MRNSGNKKESRTIDLSLVIACYNEESILEDSFSRVINVLDQTRYSYEIIFVDDCSRDNTRAIIDRLIDTHPSYNLRKLFHEHNKGRGGTVTDGFRIGRGRIVGFIDIDLEVGAHYIPPCLGAIDDGYDVATAHRIYKFYLRSLDRYIMSRGYSWLLKKLLQTDLKDTETGFKFFRREMILPVLDDIEDRHWFWDTEIMIRSALAGLKIIEIPALFMRRFDKVSSVHNFSDSLYYLKKILKFRKTVKQLRCCDRP